MGFKEGDMIICIDASYMNSLVLNEQYIVIASNSIFIDIKNKHNINFCYILPERFILDEKYYRKEKLKQLRNEI